MHHFTRIPKNNQTCNVTHVLQEDVYEGPGRLQSPRLVEVLRPGVDLHHVVAPLERPVGWFLTVPRA